MKAEAKPSSLDVFSYMARTGNNALRMAPLNNVTTINYNHKKGTEITIGWPGNITFEFSAGTLLGGLFLVDKTEFTKAQQDATNSYESLRSALAECCKALAQAKALFKPKTGALAHFNWAKSALSGQDIADLNECDLAISAALANTRKLLEADNAKA